MAKELCGLQGTMLGVCDVDLVTPDQLLWGMQRSPQNLRVLKHTN